MNTRYSAAVTVLLAAAVNPVANAVIINVPGDEPTIQAGIDTAVNGDEIVVAPGTYFETINFLGKAITLRSSGGAEVTTIDGTDLFSSVVTCDTGEGADTVLDGFTLTSGMGTDPGDRLTRGGGMYNSGSSPTVTDCTFSGNAAGDGGGMSNVEGSNPTVTDCTFDGNVAGSGGGGMGNSSSSPTVIDCTFTENLAGVRGGGMSNFDDSSPTLTGCTFDGNTAGSDGGGMGNSTSSPTVIDCTFSGNATDDGGGMFNDDSSPTVTNCTFSGNAADRGGGMSNLNSSPTVANCTFSGNSIIFGDGGGMSNSDDSSPLVTDCTFDGNTAGLGGGGMGNSSSSPTVTKCTFSGNAAGRGGGMRNRSSNPTVIDCTFAANSAGTWGGGMFNDFGSSPTVTNCTFSGNSATALPADGGGMSNVGDSNPTVTNCTFIGNSTGGQGYGGGMYNQNGSSPTVTGCTFTDNAASRGGGMGNLSCSPTVINCTFTGNSTSFDGGGMFNFDESKPTVTNCTFAGNSAAVFGGGISNHNSKPTLTDCVLWNNLPDQIHDGGGFGPPVIRYCNVEGGWTGAGNIDADPLFVDPDNGDFRLQAGSPCIDAGHIWGVSPDFVDVDGDGDTLEMTPLDLGGNPRIADDPATADTGCGIPVVVDMGAYEYQGDPTPNPIYFADLNLDGFVGVADLMILNGCIGSSDPDCCVADLDINGRVLMSDRILLWAKLIQFPPVR